MRSVCAFALFVTATLANPQISVTRLPSMLERMMADGTWPSYNRMLQATKQLKYDPQTDIYNTFYLGTIGIGTPTQNFTVLFDTGSSDLWVVDKTYSGGGDKHKYDSSQSSTYKSVPGTFSIQYGSGSVTGTKGQDAVCLSGSDYCYGQQVFGQATALGSPMNQQPLDGICGMAFPSISSLGTNPPWLNIINAPGYSAPNTSFTVWLEDLKGSPQGAIGGAFTFGTPDRLHCAASGDWVPLTHELWYEFNIDGVGVNGQFSASASAISDTGTSFLIGPTAAIDSIASAIGARYDDVQGMYTINCDPAMTTQTIDVKINGKTYPIRSKNFIVSYDNDQTCYVSMAGQDMGDPAWILGDTFIREYCNAYDLKGQQVGLFKATV